MLSVLLRVLCDTLDELLKFVFQIVFGRANHCFPSLANETKNTSFRTAKLHRKQFKHYVVSKSLKCHFKKQGC